MWMCDCIGCGASAPCGDASCPNDECRDCRAARIAAEMDALAASQNLEPAAADDPRRI